MSHILETIFNTLIGTILDVEYDIQTRTGLHCAPLIHEHMGTVPRGSIRLSVGPFNTKQHIETTIKSIAAVAADRYAEVTAT